MARSSPFRQRVVGGDAVVPLLHGRRAYTNLDNAASTPAFTAAWEAVQQFLPWYSSVHRGSGYKSRLSTAAYEEARDIVRSFVGGNANDHVVIFGKNTTEAINKLSYRIKLHKNDVVLISHLEHHSNDLPWRAQATIKRIGLTPDGGIDQNDFSRLLEKHGSAVKLVAISGASNVTGHLPNIYWFAQKTHAAGAQILVDCAQLAAHRAIDIKPLHDPAHLDYVALSAHKMYAPFGTGALIGRRDTFMQGAPEYKGGGTIDTVTAALADWAAPPDKDEAGSPNVIGAVAMARAAQELTRIGFATIVAHEAALTHYALAKLAQIPAVALYGAADPAGAAHRLGVVPFTVAGVPANLVAAILGYEWGVGVRSGCFCAQPYVASLMGITHAEINRVRYEVRHQRRDHIPGMVRISFGMYNSEQDIDQLLEGLGAIVQGRHAEYIVNKHTGLYTPGGYSEDFSQSFQLKVAASQP